MCAMRENKLEPKVITFVAATADSEPSMVLVRAVKGGASGMQVTRNLFLHDSKEDAAKSILSDDAKAIYENCSFENILHGSVLLPATRDIFGEAILPRDITIKNNKFLFVNN